MKTLKFVICMALILVCASLAAAFGPNPKDSNGFNLQQNQPSATTCTTLGAGRATSYSVPVSNVPYLGWSAYDSAGAGVVVKRSLNGAAGYMPKTGEISLAIGPTIKTVVFSRYTGATPINLCFEK